MTSYGAWPPNPYGQPPTLGPIGKRRDPAIVLLLTLVTCGLYYLYFIYVTSEETQYFLGEPDTSPGLEVLLSVISVYIYTAYWDYKMGQKIARMQQRVGLPVVDNAVLYLILNLIGLGMIPMLMQQNHLNEIWWAAAKR